MDAEFQRAYVLHSRPYTDSRILLELLCEQEGKVTAVARLSKKQPAAFAPFQRLTVLFGRGSGLKNIVKFESDMPRPKALQGKILFCGFYLNELLQRALPESDPHSQIYIYYEDCLNSLELTVHMSEAEILLRIFEFKLLDELGVAWDFNHCASSGNEISEHKCYRLEIDSGFCEINAEEDLRNGIFAGKHLLAIAERQYMEKSVMQAAKTITRKALAPILGDKPLKSRELFI